MKQMKQNMIWLKGKAEKVTIMLQNFYSHLLVIGKISRQDISKNRDLNNTTNQPDTQIWWNELGQRFKCSSTEKGLSFQQMVLEKQDILCKNKQTNKQKTLYLNKKEHKMDHRSKCEMYNNKTLRRKQRTSWDSPGDPQAKTLCSQCREPRFEP